MNLLGFDAILNNNILDICFSVFADDFFHVALATFTW